MQLITTWLLAFSILLGGLLSAPAQDGTLSEEPYEPAFRQADEPETAAEPDGAETVAAAEELPVGGVPYAEMAYEHYDPTAFYADADRLCELADDGDAEGVNALYDSLYDRFLYVDTLYCLAMLAHDADIYDDYWADEYAYMDTLWTEMADALSTAAAYALESGAARGFRAHIGYETAASLADYEPMTDEQLDRSDRELELTEEYNTLYDTMGDISCEYRGETWTLEMFGGVRGDNLWRRDYDGYWAVYDGLQQALTTAFAPIYIELAGLWAQDARDAGYDSYADYAYAEIYGRDYTPEDAQAFCDAIKPLAAAYYGDLYYSDLFDEAYSVGRMDTAELLAAVETYLPRLDGSLAEAWRCMTENGLYDISVGGAGRYSGSYTTSLSYHGSQFIFMTGEGACMDLGTLTHEFGHFTDFYLHPVPNALTGVASYDLCEIHSNGLEALFETFYPEIFGASAGAAQFADLAFLLENVIDGCMYDEFERRALAEADTLTAERLNELYLELCVEYGLYDSDSVPEHAATWVYIGHLFESPMYYISYAASGFAALQLWDIARTDMDAAVEAYLSVLDAGAYDKGYFAVLGDAGLRSFAEENAAAEVLSPVLTRLEELDAASRHR